MILEVSRFCGIWSKLKAMMLDVLEARAPKGHKPWIRLEDGLEGAVDLSGLDFSGVLAPLTDPEFFAQVNPEIGGAHPGVLYSRLTPQPLTQP